MCIYYSGIKYTYIYRVQELYISCRTKVSREYRNSVYESRQPEDLKYIYTIYKNEHFTALLKCPGYVAYLRQLRQFIFTVHEYKHT